VFLAADDGDCNKTARQFERGGNGLFEARGNALLDEQAVDDDFDGVVLRLSMTGRSSRGKVRR